MYVPEVNSELLLEFDRVEKLPEGIIHRRKCPK